MISFAARPAVLLVALGVIAVSAPVRAEEPDPVQLDKVEKQLEQAQGELDRLRAYSERGELSSLERAKQRFNEAETQFLLDSFEGCAALLQEAIDVPEFQQQPTYPRALYYLAESLYQQQSYLEARRYFREAIGQMKPGREYQDSIVRLIALSDRTGDFTGIDQYYEVASRSGDLRPEVKYLYAKWTSNRKDLPGPDRLQKASAGFAKILPDQPLYAQALFFRGAIAVQEGRLTDAADLFMQVRAIDAPPKPDPKLKRTKDLAILALARVNYELGKLSEAADLYGQLSADSVDYNDAMFETAATFVKMGNYEQALRTAEILLLIGKDSPVAPEALILKANLELRLGHYPKAAEAFNEVVQEYGQVRDQVRATLLQSADPVAYFDELLHQREGALDIVTLLPPKAQPFVNTNKEVGDAREIASELESGRKAIDESHALADSLLATLATASVKLFPQMQEGNSAASQLSTRLVSLESQLVRMQVRLLGDDLPPDVKEKLRGLEAEREQLDLKFRNLPQTQDQYEQRRAKFMKSIADLDQKAGDLRLKIQELRAVLVANQIAWETTKVERQASQQEDAEMQTRFKQDLLAIDQLDEWRESLKKTLVNERATAAASAAGGKEEELIRQRYHQQLVEMQSLIAASVARMDPTTQSMLGRIGTARQKIEGHQKELASLRARIGLKAQERADMYRARIQEEERTLDDYERGIQHVTGETRHLLGQIAYDSFSRVGKQFYDIVLKADVGLVDVAWARKKEKSDRIASLAKDKDDEVKRLQDQFREVLSDAD